jgi:16S rRNA (guanine966-N2)-methyltransferase
MRIVSGMYKNRNVYAPPGRAVRPTPERAREALFSILGSDLEGHVFLDLFAGAGTVGLEALSRGAGRAIFVEQEARALRYLRQNIDKLGCGDRCEVIDLPAGLVDADVYGRATVIFLDPPYGAEPDLPRLREYLAAAERAPVVIYQREAKLQAGPGPGMPPKLVPDRMPLFEERRYGRTIFSIYYQETVDS